MGVENVSMMNDIVRQGKALYIGLSNYDAPTLRKATKMLEELRVPFIVNQNKYNMIDRTIINNGLLDTSLELGKGLVS